MYNIAQIINGFAGLVAFSQADDPSYPRIDDDLTTSTSGRQLISTHPLCTLENIVNVAPEFHNFEYPDFVLNSAYSKGVIVMDSGTKYKSKNAIVTAATAPNADATNWVKVDPLSDWLRQVYNDACINLVAQYINIRKLNEKSKSLVELSELYRGLGSVHNAIIGQGRFVGYEIRPRKNQGLVMRLDKIGFQCTHPQDELIFYLYHSSLSEPIFEMPVVVADFDDFTWSALSDKVFGYMYDNADAGGMYYFGYYEDDLTGQAIRKDINVNNVCLSCDKYNYNNFQKWTKYVEFRAIQVPATALQSDNSLFDTAQVKHVYDSNFGINLSFAMLCDYTKVFTQNKSVFVEPLAMQLALEIINKIAFTQNIGVIADNAKKLAMAELSTKDGSGSFYLEYMKKLQGLDIDMSGFNGACLSCDVLNRIGHKVI